MELWLEIVAVILVAILGVIIGWVISQQRAPYWQLGYFLSLCLVTILVITRHINQLCFLPPFSWLVAGQLRFVTLAIIITVGLTTIIPHLPRRFEKTIICVLILVFVTSFSVAPLTAPALFKDELLNLKTKLDAEGVCLQSKSYTCAPAAAVTALRTLGFDAQEGELACLAHTSPITGTLLQCLYTALKNRYGYQGLQCQYRHFDSIGQLKNTGITLAVVKDAFLSDHCVTVLEVCDQTVLIADPAFGKINLSYEQFEKIWRFQGITLKRNSTTRQGGPASPEARGLAVALNNI